MICYFCKKKVRKHNKTTIKFKKADGRLTKVVIHKKCPKEEGDAQEET